MKICIGLTILIFSHLTWADPDPISVDLDNSKNCYHNGDWYIVVHRHAPCPSFIPIYVLNMSSAHSNPLTSKAMRTNPLLSKATGDTGGYWTHVGAVFSHHRPGDKDCLITWDYND